MFSSRETGKLSRVQEAGRQPAGLHVGQGGGLPPTHFSLLSTSPIFPPLRETAAVSGKNPGLGVWRLDFGQVRYMPCDPNSYFTTPVSVSSSEDTKVTGDMLLLLLGQKVLLEN